MTFPRRPSRSERSTDRQREHQANERTFLAWLRTSIALIGFGFAIARFGLFLRQFEAASETAAEPAASVPASAILNSQTLGIGLVSFGITVIILAAWRYNQVFWQIERGAYKPSRLAIWILTSIITLLGLLSLPLLTGPPPAKRPPNPPAQQ